MDWKNVSVSLFTLKIKIIYTIITWFTNDFKALLIWVIIIQK